MHIVPPASDLADRIEVSYSCASGHTFTRIFAADATVPDSWDCPHCGKTGSTKSQPASNDSSLASRSHWDMLIERRTIVELEGMLMERVKELRSYR